MANHPETAGSQKGRKPAIFYGWWVVSALFFVEIFGPMGRYSLAALSPFIEEELAWSKSQIGLAFGIHFWVYACLVLLVGWLVDRIGSRRVFFTGGITLMIALTFLSHLHALWQLYLFFGVVTALGVSMTHLVPTQTTCRKWFIKRAGLVGGIAFSGVNFGTAVLTPLLTIMAVSLSWRTTWFICAVSFGVIIMLLAGLVIRSTPESMGLHPDGAVKTPSAADTGSAAAAVNLTPREALHTSSFWLLFIFKSISSIPLQGMLTQIVMWGAAVGEPLATTGIFMSALTLPSIFSGITSGWLGDRYGKKPILIWTNIACLLVMLGGRLVNSQNSLLVLAFFFGISSGMVTAPVIPFMGDLYGRETLGTLVGINTFGSTFFGGFGPLVWGAIADATGSYNSACLVSAVLYAVSTIALLLIRTDKLTNKYPLPLNSG